MRVLIDTSAWIGMEDVRDLNHEQAADCWRAILPEVRHVLVSPWIFSETLTHLARKLGSEHAFHWGRRILDSRNTEFVQGDPELASRALLVMRQREDPKFSFADAASWVIARERRVDAVFAFDRHLRMPGVAFLPEDGGWEVREAAAPYRAGGRRPSRRGSALRRRR